MAPVARKVKLSLQEFVDRLRENGRCTSSRDDIENQLYDLFLEDGALNMRKFIDQIKVGFCRVVIKDDHQITF